MYLPTRLLLFTSLPSIKSPSTYPLIRPSDNLGRVGSAMPLLARKTSRNKAQLCHHFQPGCRRQDSHGRTNVRWHLGSSQRSLVLPCATLGPLLHCSYPSPYTVLLCGRDTKASVTPSELMIPRSCLLGKSWCKQLHVSPGKEAQGGQLPENEPTGWLPGHSLPSSLTSTEL